MLTWVSHATFYNLQTPSVCLLNHTRIPLSWHLPPGWGSLRRVLRWLEVRARTIRRIFPAGCAVSWRMRRWGSRSSEPESTRCHSTSSHPPAGSTAPYLGEVMDRHKDSFTPKPMEICIKIFLHKHNFWDYILLSPLTFLNEFPSLRHIYTCGHIYHMSCMRWKLTQIIAYTSCHSYHHYWPKSVKKQTVQLHKQTCTHSQAWTLWRRKIFASIGIHYMVICLNNCIIQWIRHVKDH